MMSCLGIASGGGGQKPALRERKLGVSYILTIDLPRIGEIGLGICIIQLTFLLKCQLAPFVYDRDGGALMIPDFHMLLQLLRLRFDGKIPEPISKRWIPGPESEYFYFINTYI